MGNMHSSTKKFDDPDLQGDFAIWVCEQLKEQSMSVSQLADDIGESRSETSRAISRKRKFTYREVFKISQRFGIQPPAWNSIGNPSPKSRFLPLCGNIVANVWRVRGEIMPQVQSPIRPIDIGEDGSKEQQCYYINDGPYAEEYVVCIKIDDAYKLEDQDIVVVSITRLLPPVPTEVIGFALMIAQHTDEGIRLCQVGESSSPPPLSPDTTEVVGLAIGFFRSVRKKSNTPSTQNVDRGV